MRIRSMGGRHPAWPEPEPEWTPLAPGVRWRLRRPNGADQAVVAADVASVMARIYEGRAGLEELGLDPELDTGGALTLDRIAGYASILTACLYAQRCLLDWELRDPATGQPLDVQDPEAVRTALLEGPPDGGAPLLTAFLAWVQGPQQPMAWEAARLKDLAHDHWSGGAERCRACVSEAEDCARGASTEGALCPRLQHAPRTAPGQAAWDIASTTSGLWIRSGLSAALTGLDYGAALLIFESRQGGNLATADVGAAFIAFRAIEQGRLKAEMERADAEGPAHG